MTTFNVTLIAVSAAAAASETADHSGDHGGGTFPPFDPTYFPSQLFWLTVLFGLLLLLLAKVFLPRLRGILEERSNHIADDLDSAARMQREAELAETQYERALSDARAKAHNVAETTRASINAEIETETAAADAQSQNQVEIAEGKIAAMRTAALANVDDIAAGTAHAIAERLLGGKVSMAAAGKAVKAVQ